MSIKLKQAAQQALNALDEATTYTGSPSWSPSMTDECIAAASALRTALAQQPATGEPVYWEWRHLSTHPDTVDFGKWSEWKRVEARSAIHTIEDALAEFRAYIAQGHKYELRALYDHPAPSAPADVVRVPVQVLKDASEALGNFVSDHGWGDADMQAMDNLDAYIARHEANRAAMLAAKDTK